MTTVLTLSRDCLATPAPSPDDLSGLASLIFAEARVAGMLVNPGPLTPDMRAVRESAREWIEKVETSIDAFTPGDALALTGPFDMIHRIAFGRPARAPFLDRYRLAAFEARIRGDKTVCPYTLHRIISAEIKRGNPLYLGRPLDWKSDLLRRWHTLHRFGPSLTPTPMRQQPHNPSSLTPDPLRQQPHNPSSLTPDPLRQPPHRGMQTAANADDDTRQRVAILLESDLYAFEASNEPAYKLRLFAAHRHLLPTLNTSSLTLNTLRPMPHNPLQQPLQNPSSFAATAAQSCANSANLCGYAALLTASIPYLTPDEFADSEEALRLLTLSCPTLNPYRRLALSL